MFYLPQLMSFEFSIGLNLRLMMLNSETCLARISAFSPLWILEMSQTIIISLPYRFPAPSLPTQAKNRIEDLLIYFASNWTKYQKCMYHIVLFGQSPSNRLILVSQSKEIDHPVDYYSENVCQNQCVLQKRWIGFPLNPSIYEHFPAPLFPLLILLILANASNCQNLSHLDKIWLLYCGFHDKSLLLSYSTVLNLYFLWSDIYSII